MALKYALLTDLIESIGFFVDFLTKKGVNLKDDMRCAFPEIVEHATAETIEFCWKFCHQQDYKAKLVRF